MTVNSGVTETTKFL